MPSRDGLQRILTLYVSFCVKNKISGSKFGDHLDKGIEKRVQKREDPPAHGFFLLLSLLSPSLLPRGKESKTMGYERRREQKKELDGFTITSRLAPSSLLDPLSLLGIQNPVLLPILGSA